MLESFVILTGVGLSAVGAAGGVGPNASAGVLVEVKTCRAGDLRCLPLDAVVEDMANRLIGMREVAVPPGAEVVRLWWF